MPKKKKIVVATGGGFDPLHEGHIRLFKEAKKLGDELVIMLNSDAQVKKKKGSTFYVSQDERKEIVESIRYVDKVVIDSGKDTTCEAALRLIKPDILAKGGDRVPGAMPEVELKVCEELGIKIVYNVGGEKVQSSSWLLKRQKESPQGAKKETNVDKFENVTVVKKANVYFNGNVTSRTVLFADGSRKTLGIILPGEYEFGTADKERMEILAGTLKAQLPGSKAWKTFESGQAFEIPANSKFKVSATEPADYCCSYFKA